MSRGKAFNILIKCVDSERGLGDDTAGFLSHA